MNVETKYIAEDGRSFRTEQECAQYERDCKLLHKRELQRTMLALDEELWKFYFPQSSEVGGECTPEHAHIWLRHDIESILSNPLFPLYETAEKIQERVLKEKYGDEILNYVGMERRIKAAKIRRNWNEALKGVRSGSDISSIIGWVLSSYDLRSLAQLHKSGKQRKKIEDLLTDCNFHYECGKFYVHDYTEFLDLKEEER